MTSIKSTFKGMHADRIKLSKKVKQGNDDYKVHISGYFGKGGRGEVNGRSNWKMWSKS
jgi:hypothetical protein